MVDTSDEWIVSRTGIRERHIAEEHHATSDLAARAGERALACAGLSPADVDLLIVGTSSPDYLFPSTACVTQSKLGLTCPAYDVNAACSGFIFALQAGTTAIESGRHETVLVIGADALTRHIDFTDRATCVLFGDGAGAVVLRAAEEPGVLAIELGADGTGARPSQGSGGWLGGTVYRGAHPQSRAVPADERQRGLQVRGPHDSQGDRSCAGGDRQQRRRPCVARSASGEQADPGHDRGASGHRRRTRVLQRREHGEHVGGVDTSGLGRPVY